MRIESIRPRFYTGTARWIGFFLVGLFLLSNLISIQAREGAPAFCSSPSPSQLHTLLVLASIVKDTFSTDECASLYQQLYQFRELNLENKSIEDLTPI